MSEFLAEARVTIVPDTTKFRALLEAQLTAATRRPIVVPVVASATGLAETAVATQGVAAAQKDLARTADTVAVSSSAASKALNEEAVAARVAGAAVTKASVAHQSLAINQKQVRQGALSSVLSLAGVRGATLAASSSFLLAAGSAVVLFKSLAIAADVEKQLNTFRVTAKATAADIAAVSARARQLGNDIRLPAVSAGDAITAMVELSKAGLSVADSLEAAEGSLQLATAAEIDNASAVELVANALNVFQLSGREASTVADLLAASANEAQGTIADMGIALRQSAAVAKQAGLSLSDTVTLLTLLAQRGLAGSDAGTTLRVAISRLIAPTERARDEIKKLNLDLRDAQGNLRVDVFTQLGTALEGISKAEQSEILVRIFGENAQRVGAILSDVTNPALRETEKAVTRAGVAAEVSGAKVEGLGGKMERAKNEAADLGLTIGTIFSPAAGVSLDALSIGLDQTNATLQQGIKGFKELGDQVRDDLGLLRQFSNDTGFTKFVSDVDEGGKLLQGDFERAGKAIGDFFSRLSGGGEAARDSSKGIDVLTAAEKKMAESTRDANLGLAEQISQLNKTREAAEAAAAKMPTAVATLDLSLATSQAQGDTGGELEALRQREANQQRFIDRLSARTQDAATVKTLTQANRNLDQTRSQITAILDKQVATAEGIARDAASAQDKTDRAFLTALEGREARIINQELRAESTAGLKDDIATQVTLRNFFKRAIVEVRNTVKDAELAASTIASLTRDFISAKNEIANLKRQQREAVKEERRAERERLRESLSLDVQIAQATGNKAAEERARQAEIDRIKEEIRQTRAGSNQRKRLILELRQKQAELKELRKEKEATNKQAQDLTFFFLQQQQGFAANLLGNLIPGSATAGLVGGGSGAAAQAAIRPPGLGVTQESQVAQGKDVGFSAGQGNTTNSILRKILHNLEILNGHSAHPEARNQRIQHSGSANYTAM